jgi:acetyl/propionyl-CoA carboxylase alpha subunit/acetyl-CoA carboxylase carboxyltransferase component
MRSIQRLAIVNRGEPVIRVLAAVAELNDTREAPPIKTIVLYTDPDAGAWYVREADEAFALGPARYVDPADGRSKSRYLDEPTIINALRITGADAVWVGWGFLAERASFAQRCEEAGILYIGPDSATIRLLGNKIEAKHIAEGADVPVVPWSGEAVVDADIAARHARRLGYPVMVKAASGGGGRGIRFVHDETGLAQALTSARDEAEATFGDATVFLEKAVPAARHVEVQIIGDDYGTIWAPGIRDCTIQRRHQKVIEESSSPGLSPATEAAIVASAVRLAAAVGYRNAGTVEFLVDPDTADFLFMEVNTRLQVEHPVTEQSAGIDLVKLQLHVARGGRLDGAPPPVSGYAIEARLCAEDPENQFAPASGRLAVFTMPSGPGIRVDSGMRAGDVVAAEYDSMIAKIIAWGHDRPEALARLRRGLAQTTVVVEGGTTNLSFLRALLDRPEVRGGRLDTEWLDRLTVTGGHLPAADPVAILHAAIESYQADETLDREAFHARAARGRPVSPAEVGHRCQLRYRGAEYALRVFRTGPGTYRVDAGDAFADIAVTRINDYERRIEVGGHRHRVISAMHGSSLRIDIDGVAHRVSRDDGGVVRSGWPALVVSVHVKPGDQVATGDPLLVVEAMKMETTIAAPFDGEVSAVEVTPNTQVDAGIPLMRIRPGAAATAGGDVLDLRGFATPAPDGAPTSDLVYRALSGYLLGYDLDQETVRDILAAQRRLEHTTPPADAGLLGCEDALLELFSDVGSLYRPRAETEPEDALTAGSTREYMLSYLQWLDPVRAGLPDHYRDKLEHALLRYGIPSLDRTPALEQSVVWMFRSFSRVDALVPVVTNILERRLRHRDALAHLVDGAMRTRLDRIAVAAQGRHQLVADLARDVRFRYFDEPLLAVAVDAESATVNGHLDALRADPPDADRGLRMERLIASPQPLRGELLRRWLAADNDHFRQALLEVYVRRHYRIRDLRGLSCAQCLDHLICTADYDIDGRGVHLVVAYAPLSELPSLSKTIATHLIAAAVDPNRDVVVDVTAWQDRECPDGDALAAELEDLLSLHCDFGRRLHRLDFTVTGTDGLTAEHRHTRHVTFRQPADGTFTEQRLYRDLHPMLAKRLDLWRLANFELTRLASAEDIYLFHGVAHDNPTDRRLFALAEVRDFTPAAGAVDTEGTIALPRLELLGLQALSAMRQALGGFAESDRPTANRIVLDIRPPWTTSERALPALARTFAPLAIGAGLERVILRVRIPEADGGFRNAVLHLEGIGGRGVTVRESTAGQSPIRSLTPYRQKVLRAKRLGAPYPYELVRMLAPPPGALTRFPTGHFVEHDLDHSGALMPVDRPSGLNTANIVVGLLTNNTVKVAEGMTRVALLSDPTRGLGNLSEPECRRVIAALDVAERLRIPVEWFALSSGARIAMDSGTENMDWIAAVLRRIIEFTQGGGEVNIVVTGVNVGAQPYWNAEATMLMHTRGILIMTPSSAMVLTGKHALDFSGGVSADDNFGIGGFDPIMGPNGQGQYWAPTLEDAYDILLAHYSSTYVVPGEPNPRRAVSTDPRERDVCSAPHPSLDGGVGNVVGDVFSAEHNGDRKKPFDIRAVMRSVSDMDSEPLERWAHWRDADTVVVWDAHLGGIPVCLLGIESRTLPRHGFLPADGPSAWNSGTLFPQASRKLARAVNAASGNRPLVVLANLSGFDGSPESMRRWQLEYGAEIGRAITNFRGPIVFVVVARYHGGAFVVFSKRLNKQIEIAAVEGSYASVIGGAPAAATVFAREVMTRTDRDPRVRVLMNELNAMPNRASAGDLRARLAEVMVRVRSEKLGDVADEFDQVHDIRRAMAVGSVDRIIAARDLRPYLIDAVERGLAHDGRDAGSIEAGVQQVAR